MDTLNLARSLAAGDLKAIHVPLFLLGIEDVKRFNGEAKKYRKTSIA